MSLYAIVEKIREKYGIKGELVYAFGLETPERKKKFCKALNELALTLDYFFELRKKKKVISDREMEKIDRKVFRNHYTISRIIADIISSWSKPWLERNGGSPMGTGGSESELEFYEYRPDTKLAHIRGTVEVEYYERLAATEPLEKVEKTIEYDGILEDAIVLGTRYKSLFIAIPDTVKCETAYVEIFVVK